MARVAAASETEPVTERDPDLEAFEKVRDYRPPKELPKIAEVAWALYAASGDRLEESDIDNLRLLLEKREDLKALADDLCGLSAFQIYVGEHLGDEATATRVAALIQESLPRYEPMLRRALRKLHELGGEAKKALSKLFGHEVDGERRAPVHDAPAPEGTVPLRTLKPQAQPPPWVKKARSGR